MMLMTQLPVAQRAAQLASHADEHLRLDGENDHVRVRDGGAVVLDRADAVARDELVAPIGARMARDDLLGCDLVATKQPGDHGLGHDAGANSCDARAPQRHGRSLLVG